MRESGIDWAKFSWGPWRGCTPVSPGCDHCYAARDMRRFGHDPTTVVRAADRTFEAPYACDRKGDWKWPDESVVFVCPWSDYYHAAADRWRYEAFRIMEARPGLRFVIVTKRPERMGRCVTPPHTTVLVTCENQEVTDARLPVALRHSWLPVGVSLEPLLSPVDLADAAGCTYWDDPSAGLAWCVVGCESGPNRRPCSWEWLKAIIDQCAAGGVPCYVKQVAIPKVGSHGSTVSRNPAEWPEWARVRQTPGDKGDTI